MIADSRAGAGRGLWCQGVGVDNRQGGTRSRRGNAASRAHRCGSSEYNHRPGSACRRIETCQERTLSPVAIVTDGCASIPSPLIHALNIRWVAYYIHRGREALRDLVTIQPWHIETFRVSITSIRACGYFSCAIDCAAFAAW